MKKKFMNREVLPCVEINPNTTPKAVIIWLHGLGADGHDFEPIVPELRLPASLPIRFVFPHSPERPVTLNGGMIMRAWYDIYGADLSQKKDINGIKQSAELTKTLIQKELDTGISSEQIVLAGFSQGGVIALHTGLRYEKKLAGILALSTYLPTLDSLKTERSEANLLTPIMMGHGTMDPVVQLDRGKSAFEALAHMGYQPTWNEYPMPHSVCAEEINDIANWLIQILR